MKDASVQGLLVLGLLAEGPWTAYDLVKYLSRPSITSVFWNASESTWYREPGRLVLAGLAEAHESTDGSPTRYTITEAGRRALHRAAASEHRFVHRNEGMAILYATAAAPLEEIDERLTTMQATLLEAIEDMAITMRQLAESGPLLAQRAHISALLGRFAASAAVLAYEWAVDARHELAELGPTGDRAQHAQHTWRTVADDLDRFIADHRARDEHRPDPGK